MSHIPWIAVGFLLCFLVCSITLLPIYFSERRKYRLAQARCQLTVAVTKMDQLMLDAKVVSGELCHDRLYRMMYASQFDERRLRFGDIARPFTVEEKAFVRRLEAEVAAKGEDVAKLVGDYLRAYRRIFKYGQPYVYLTVCVSVLFMGGGLMVLLKGMDGYGKLKTTVAEWLLAMKQTRLEPNKGGGMWPRIVQHT